MKSVRDIDVSSKTVFVRVDYNVPVDEALNITDDNRIMATLDLIQYLIKGQAKIILASHMGRPNGKKDSKLSLAPVGKRLAQLLEKPVLFVEDCIGDNVTRLVAQLTNGQILLLENLRFHNEEKDNNEGFAKKLADLCDVYVNNAFAVSHRNQASVTGIPRFARESAAGFLLEKEVQSYYDYVENPKRPLVAIIGGAKVSSKLAALENMLKFVDKLVIGGAMANTFLKSQGVDTKGSIIEEDLLNKASDIVKKSKEQGVDFLLPCDLICAEKFDKNARVKEVLIDQIPDQWMAMDIGPKTALKYTRVIKEAQTIVWNGPMGVFEMEQFMSGTRIIAEAIADSSAFSVVGGGDTGLAAKKCNVADKVSYVSTGGGAFLHLMEGKKLPGVVALE
ncbi:MAG: phosphoglycerate kinase [Desulfobacula sp.]|jgi:phosphoglycerate kinase|uniref:phosphoglycerate kinase n=1 Tax=Desulfobacula sp. TaxID=2593537 RepID=UPI001D94E383|nr:phosphoglycerate kinase [Desulfobacula sp.]MBT3484983.1 phosphoglycerate kinase [Desulfobacula sp.]MBT3804200.1 phosphoglycerate kinase [Desulfobacula sp.]MBT4025056.1 phosphoglycerate kinase [Desulfobacula sp.]MBT4198634.1 phosphoglycerate kinase [Desulfobacula sp.]